MMNRFGPSLYQGSTVLIQAFFVLKTVSYLSVQKNNNERLAAVNKSSPAIVFFLPSLSIKSIVNSIPAKLQTVKWPTMMLFKSSKDDFNASDNIDSSSIKNGQQLNSLNLKTTTQRVFGLCEACLAHVPLNMFLNFTSYRVTFNVKCYYFSLPPPKRQLIK